MNNKKANTYISLFYLMWIITIDQWKVILSFLIITLLTIPLSPLIVNSGGSEFVSYGIIGLFVILPTILITLVLLPIIHQQISSSSIQKRLKASNISKISYNIVIIMLISLIAILTFYFMVSLALIIFPHIATGVWDPESEEFVNGYYYSYSISFLGLFIFSPLAIIGLASTGAIIAKIKISEIVKGILIFIFILVCIIMSRTIWSPLNSDVVLSSENYEKAINLNNILFLNPWGSMFYTLETSINNDILTNVEVINDSALTIPEINTINSYLYSLIWTLILLIPGILL